MKELTDLIVGLVGGAVACALFIAIFFSAKYLDFFAKRRLEEHKQRLVASAKLRGYVMVPRIKAYRVLWSLMEPISPTLRTTLTASQRQELDANFRAWYYEDGCGMFLSLESQKAFLKARAVLQDKSSGDIVGAFSQLRTKMKLDLAVYGLGDEMQEADVSKGTPEVNPDGLSGTFS